MASNTTPPLRRGDVPFLSRPDTHRMIERLAASRTQDGVRTPAMPLTIFAGAGVTRDAGAPTWDELVIQLLVSELANSSPTTSRKDRQRVASEIVAAYGPLASASAVVELFLTNYNASRVTPTAVMPLVAEEIAKSLYSRHDRQHDGALAQAIVRLCVFLKAAGGDVAIITTNYDDNFENFAGDAELAKFARDAGVHFEPLTDDGTVAPGAIPVFHLHGYIPRSGPVRGNFAFSEAGLHHGGETVGQAPKGLDWRAQVIERRLGSSNTLFVGTTMRDPTVINALLTAKQAGADRPLWAGIFTAQGDTLNHGPDAAALTAHVLESRLRHLGVTLIRPDFFGQVPTFLNEIPLCYGHNSRYTGSVKYGRRLERWWSEWRRIAKPGVSSAPSRDACQVELAKAKQRILRILRATQVESNEESFKLELWVRLHPNQRRMALWGSSESVNRSGNNFHECDIEAESRYYAIRAFCKGTAAQGDVEPDGRWRSHYSVPIALPESPWYGLPVGVINLMSTQPAKRSALGQAPEGRRTTHHIKVRNAMDEVGRELLSPLALTRAIDHS